MTSSGVAAVRGGHLALSLTLVVGLVGVLSWIDGGGKARAAMQRRELEASAFGAGGRAEALRRAGLIHALPPRRSPAEVLAEQAAFSGLSFDQAKRYGLEPVPSLGEALAIEPRWLGKGISVISLWLDPSDLADLHAHPDGRGQQWERPGFVAFVRDGASAFTSPVGVRIHGGWTRRAGPAWRSYRLHFRDQYGAESFTPPIFSQRVAEPPSTLVIRNDGGLFQRSGEFGYFASSLGYDIARQIGCPAPETHHAVFFLNGRFLGLKALTEYIDQDFVRSRFGHGDFALVRTKQALNETAPWAIPEDPTGYGALRNWAQGFATNPDFVTSADSWIDIDNLYRWATTILVCGTTDQFQGVAIRDQTDPHARWRWIAWDLDRSFGLQTGDGSAAATENVFPRLLHHRGEPRAGALNGLLARPGSPSFVRFQRLLTDTMNHVVTDEFLRARLEHYRALAGQYHVSAATAKSLGVMEEFLAQRKAAIRRQMRRHLGAGRSHRVEVAAPANQRLVIDGYPVEGPYVGWYYAGMTVTVRVADGWRPHHWLVDGRPHPGDAEIQLEVHGDVRIEAVVVDQDA